MNLYVKVTISLMLCNVILMEQYSNDSVLCLPRPSAPIISIPGEAIITALLDGHMGENCTVPANVGLQQMAAVAWAVSTANVMNLVPEVKIGLEVFDTCSEEREILRAAKSALAETECGDRYTLGVISSVNIMEYVQSILDALEIEILDEGILPAASNNLRLSNIAAEFLNAVNITQISVLSDSVQTIQAFSSSVTEHNICVTWEQLLSPTLKEQGGVLDTFAGTVLIVAPWSLIKLYLNMEANSSKLQWLVAPTDVSWETLGQDAAHYLREDTFLIAQSNVGTSSLNQALQNETWLSEVSDWTLLQLPGTLLQQVSEAVQLAAHRLKLALKADCQDAGAGICPELRPLSQHPKVSLDTVDRVIPIPKESWNLNSEQLIRIGRKVNGKIELLTEVIGREIHQKFEILNSSLITNCDTCVCLNPVSSVSLWQSVTWRHEVWVAAITSVATVGVACAIAVALFIIVRICKGDVLEGNPTFSFLLLFSVVVAYAAVLPYCAAGPQLLCALRDLGTSLGHALLLVTMLARAIMLATTDDQGFMSHVNGFLQAILWFFIMAVQIALSTQHWLSHYASLDTASTFTCPSDGISFVLLLSYNMFLLFLLLLICPLVVRSKRNYREGLCFSVATWLYVGTWLSWLAAYLLAPTAWRGPAAAAGLLAGASAVLLAVFIPRTYLMVSSVARARLASAIPCTAAGMNSSSVLDINYRSSHQALYDSVNVLGSRAADAAGFRRGSTGLANPNYYSQQHANHSAASTVVAFTRGRLSPSPQNTYERYDSPPSPHKVTRF